MRSQPPKMPAAVWGHAGTFLAVLALIISTRPAPAQPAGGDETVKAPVRIGPDGQLLVDLDRNQRREVGSLVSRLRRAGDDSEKLDAVVEEAVKLGPAQVGGLFLAIDKMLAPQVVRYCEKLQQHATALATKQALSHQQEILRLRETVRRLSADPNLTKEAIVAQADPAVARLAAIFRIDVNEVLKASSGLAEERRELAVRGGQWEKCAAYLDRTFPELRERLGGDGDGAGPSFDGYLRREEAAAMALALPMDPKSRAVLAADARLAAQLDREEARAVAATNSLRLMLGLNPLWIDVKLCAAARDHSQDMQKLNFFSHQSPVAGKGSFPERARRFGTTASSENIYQGTADGEKVVQGWFHSPPHHKNLLGDHQRVGVGRSGKYYTQMFGG